MSVAKTFYPARMISFETISRYRLADIGTVLAEPARAAIVLALMDGSARPAGELADIAAVSPATASVHLRKLCEGGLLTVIPQGRHRYYRIASDDVAQVVETLSLLGVPKPAITKRSSADEAMSRVRTCYRHLAGRLGVALFESLSSRRAFSASSGALRLTSRGRRLLVSSALIDASDDIATLLGRPCVDWTERQFHLAGPLGTQLSQRFFDCGWLRRRRASRALIVSPTGEAGFAALGIDRERWAG